MKEYKPQGALRRVFDEQFDDLIISGSAGTGKSRACLEYMHQQAEANPGFRGVIFRAKFLSLENTARVTYEQWVLPHPTQVRFDTRLSAYVYPNGSTIALASLAKEPPFEHCDLLFVQEVTELTKKQWETASRKARKRLADCNPDEPEHWVWAGRGAHHELLESSHEDNPRFYDEARQEFTEHGRRWVACLDELTGVTKERLRHGRWCKAVAGHIYFADRRGLTNEDA